MSKKGYWIALIDIANPEGYKAYIEANAAAFQKYGANFLVRNGTSETVEGPAHSRVVVKPRGPATTRPNTPKRAISAAPIQPPIS